MANIREYRDKEGKLISFHIKVYKGRDKYGKQLRPYSTTLKVDPSWTEKRARKEAEKFAFSFEAECKNGYQSASNITLSDYIDRVIEIKENRGQLKKRTLARLKSDAKRVNSYIGHKKLKSIRVSDLNNFYSELSENLSPKTIVECHRLINMVLSYAVKEGIISTNVAQRAEVPKINKQKEVRYYQKEEIQKILEAADKESLKHKLLINLFVFTGCRRAEIVGLKWDNIDLDNNKIHICNSVLYTKEDGIFEDTPKTSKSVRNITVPDELINILREYKKVSYTSNFVFERKDGGPLHPDSINKYLSRFSKKYDLPHINSHAFRHTMASMLYYEGMDPVSISARLGHSRVSITSDIYAHVVNTADNKNSDILAKIYLKNKE